MKKKLNLITNIERYTPLPTQGLSFEQVNERKCNQLTNTSTKKYSKSILSIFIQNIFTFFNLLGLIVMTALIVFDAPISSFFFVLIYICNILIGIIQEIRSKITIDRLSLLSTKHTKVLRNGEIFNIHSKAIVLDDILLLGIGNQVPTDCKIVEGFVEVNESLLTGESVAVKKKVGDRLFAGSFIVGGNCKVHAVKVGKDNYVEQLSAKAKKYKKPYSKIMSSLKYIIKIVSFIVIPMTILYISKALIKDAHLQNAVLRTSSVVIGMIPSGMFLLTSMALAVGVIKLARQHTLVQDLYSLEMLARVDTICFDKTGTITDGRMSIKEVVELKSDLKYPVNSIISNMLKNLNDSNQTSTALCEKFGYSNTLRAESILPFNSKRKLSAVTFVDEGTYAFGAPEFILSQDKFEQVEHIIMQYAQLGIRVILLGHSNGKIDCDDLPNDFEPIALILINDNIRDEAIETVKWFKQNDVEIKVISGDNPITVSEVSKRVGIENADRIISLEGLTDEQVFAVANEYTVFGRVSPEQKAILIKAMKLAGHTVAMTGDGVNDILAMKEADCAVTVASGSDAARNVSNLVLTDNNFNSMPKIVKEGRRVINNVQSSASLYLMKTIFTMLLSFIILLLPSQTYYPFELQQMILLEVFVIGLPSFFLSLQPNEARVEGSFINYILSKSLPSGVLMVCVVLLTKLAQILMPNYPANIYSTIEVFAVVFAGIVSLMFICKPFNKFRIVLFTSVVTVVTVIVAYSIMFGLTPLCYASFMPIQELYPTLICLVIILLLEIPIYLLIRYIFSSIKWNLIKTKISNKENKA